MASFHPRPIKGLWEEGYALDLHTLESQLVGADETGRPVFDTRRSDVGELLYRFKYSDDHAALPGLVTAATTWLTRWNPGVDVIVPVPASRYRAVQPVLVLAEAIAKRVDLPVENAIHRLRQVPELKDIHDLDARNRILDGLHSVTQGSFSGRRVLLFDDLFRSGATLNAIAKTVRDQGQAKAVFAFTITRTRRNQ